MGLEPLLADPTYAPLLQFLFDNERKVLPEEHVVRRWEDIWELKDLYNLPLIPKWEFDCEVCSEVTACAPEEVKPCHFCGQSLAEYTPRHVVEFQQMASNTELFGLLKDRLTQVGLNEADFCMVDDHCQLHNVEIRLIRELRSIDDLYSVVDTAQPPVLILTKRPPAQRPAAFARHFLLDVSVHNLVDFWFDEPALHQFVSSFSRPASIRAPAAPLTIQFQLKSPTIRNALPNLHLYGLTATTHMLESMYTLLERKPDKLVFFDTSLSRNDFLEHWVHLCFLVMTRQAYKLGCIGKEARIPNPKWPDGTFELPHKRDPINHRTRYAYDATLAHDFDKEIEQAQTYLRLMVDNFDQPVDYYYIISTECPSDDVWPRYESLLHRLDLPATIVFLAVREMLTILEHLHGKAELWELLLCFELETLLNRDKSFTVQDAVDRRRYSYGVIKPDEVGKWLKNLDILIETGRISAHPGYQARLRQQELVTGSTILPKARVEE